MLILGVETATRYTSVALVNGDHVLAEHTYSGPLRPSQVLMAMVDRVLRDAGVGRSDLQGVAVGCGPGSFTGLRLGLATAQALAYALGIPVVGVSTLETMSFPWLRTGCLVVPVLDAQRGRVYAAGFPRDPAGFVPRTVEWEALLDHLAARGSERATAGVARVILVGEWAWVRREEVASRLGEHAVVVEPHLGYPRAAAVAHLGRAALLAGSPGDPLALRAVYLRRSEAEELWEKRRSGTSSGCI
ncbi:MAG: tRNA (adenosine(37)-N6)-threonylcarbamoyltransferase complex dimerization subunit type 1 TsaB [Firmicutes bacterium]|nr:tRNA (adenosine(37)-N6)-threonylcarbamoyltransferase complex dimerization subunit type 1 TsaB [Bacillota bacterium]